MDSSSQPDLISTLPDVLLIMIISCLSFRDSVRTSTLSRRWKHLCHETKNIAFNETEYAWPRIYSERVTRIMFVRYMCRWVSRFRGQAIESFEIRLSEPVGFLAEMRYLIEFAVSKKVKKLVLDFSNPAWTKHSDAPNAIVNLPACFYRLRTLETLTVYSCGFEPSSFVNPGLLRSLYVGWSRLKNVEALLEVCPLLETLSIRYCWELDLIQISGQLREVVIEKCDLPLMSCSFDLPNVDFFKYSGYILSLHFQKMKRKMKEVHLDFTAECGYDEPCASEKAEGEIISCLLNDLRSVETLTVCPYLLQVIQECTDPVFLLRDLKPRHLVLRTKLNPKEYKGIRILLDNCPRLHTLTFDFILPEPSNPLPLTYRGVDMRTHWHQDISYRCLIMSLRVVVFKNFTGAIYQLDLLHYLIRCGCERELVLERIELYLPNWFGEVARNHACRAAMMLQRTTQHVQVTVHYAL